jgi:hypothetical protein
MYPKKKAYSQIMIEPTTESEGGSARSSERVSEAVTLEALLELVPIGRFHFRLLVICGMAFMADAMEVSE